MLIEVVRRIGVLTPLADDGDGAAVAVGDVAAHHVRLRADGLLPAFGASPTGFVPWRHVRRIEADVPATWMPAPAVADAIGPLLDGIFGGSGARLRDAHLPHPDRRGGRFPDRVAGDAPLPRRLPAQIPPRT